MTPDPTPPGTHPTDAMLLFLGDVRSDADAAGLVAELGPDEAAGTFTDDDPFAPALVADAWSHLGACDHCSARRMALFVESAPAISSVGLDAYFAPSAVARRVGAAVAELVPAAAAVPESLVRSVPPRRRWFAGRGGAEIGAPSGRGGAVARPWIAGVAVTALLLAVGAAFALRPRTTEQSAVGTVPPRVETASPSDTNAPETRVSAETEASAGNEAALTAGAMADEPAAIAPSIGGAPAATPNPSADPAAAADAAPVSPAPEATPGRSASPPAAASPARASSKTASGSADAAIAEANPVQPQPAKKKAPAPPPVASAAVAAAPPAGGFEQPTAAADLGTFTDVQSALDRFGLRVTPVVPADGASTQLGQQPQTANTANPAAAVVPSTEPVVCPTVKGSPRLDAHIVDRPVLIVRIADATADVVLDATTCAEIARRPVSTTTVPAG